MRAALLLAAALSGAAPVRAQFVQYTAPGSLGDRSVTTQEQLEATMELAPWDLGPLRLGPWLELRDVSWVQDPASEESDDYDLTATASAGLHAYVPFSRKLTLGAYWLPEYVWWDSNEQRSLWNWRYGAGLFGYFNRLTIELRYVDERQQQYLSSEFEELINIGRSGPQAGLDVEFLRRLHLFGRYSLDEWRHREEDLPEGTGVTLVDLDRDEEMVTAGLRYTPSETVSIGAGYQWYATDFIEPERDRSNEGSGPVLELDLNGKRLRVAASVAWLDLAPSDASSEFLAFTETSGDFNAAWKPGSRLEFQLYGTRRPSYTLSDPSPYYLTERWGLALVLPLGRLLNARAYWEDGQDLYTEVPGVRAERQDDVSSLGLDFDMPLGRGLSFHLGGSSTDYSSTEPGQHRTIERLQFSLRVSGPGGGWW
jgi:hypothetical protein